MGSRVVDYDVRRVVMRLGDWIIRENMLVWAWFFL